MKSLAITNPATIETMNEIFKEGPAEVLVSKMITALSSLPEFVKLFGPYKGIAEDNQRWADYQRFDWSMRQLPAICIYEDVTDDKTSDNGWLNGTVKVMVFWPAALRRSALARIPQKFWSAFQLWLNSKSCYSLLDPMPGFNTETKCPGLNELGKVAMDTKNVAGIANEELVPVTNIDVKFRIDLRKWNLYLEQKYRTVLLPFDTTLKDFEGVVSVLDGSGISGVIVTDGEPGDSQILVPVNS